MQRLLVLAVIGLVAQFIDGSLGMAYGATSSSLLLAFGITPAVASASVHLAEIATTAASGISHLRLGNVDGYILATLILPGAASAFLGAILLGALPGDVAVPFVAIFLLGLGGYILMRFLRQPRDAFSSYGRYQVSRAFLVALGSLAGFADATGGGGWGPIATPALILSRQVEPRRVVGSVDASEFFVALAASAGFLFSLGWEQVNWSWVLALILGGIIAAPLAAYAVKYLPPRFLGTAVGGVILITNSRTLVRLFGVAAPITTWVYLGLVAILGSTLVIGWVRSVGDVKLPGAEETVRGQ